MTAFVWVPSFGQTEFTIVQSDSPHRIAVLQASIKKFEQLNPNIRVKHIPTPGGQLRDRLNTLTAAGTPPDVTSHFYYVSGGMDRLALPLDSLIARDNVDMSDFFPQALEAAAVSYKGSILGMPTNLNTYGVFYNKEMFAEAGIAFPTSEWFHPPAWTWDHLLEIALKFTKDTNGDGKIEQWGLEGLDEIWYFGAGFYGERHFRSEPGNLAESVEYIWTNENAVAWYQFLQDLIYKHKVVPSKAERSSLRMSFGLPNLFTGGKAPMILSGSWSTRGFAGDLKFPIGIASLPGMKKQTTIMFVDSLQIAKTSKNVDAAWEWVKWITSPEQIKTHFVRGDFGLPPYKSLASWYASSDADEITGYNNPSPGREVLVRGGAFGTPDTNIIVGVGRRSAEIRQAAGELRDALWLRNISGREFIQQFKERTDKIFQQ